MRAKLDRTICGGRGLCQPHAPHLFSRDEWGYSSLTTNDVPAGDESAVRNAIVACPFKAIGELEAALPRSTFPHDQLSNQINSRESGKLETVVDITPL
jgi:ferredoxin